MKFFKIPLIAVLLFAGVGAGAMEYRRIEALESMEYVSVYSISQDSMGAIWINCNYGLCRFNGHSLQYVHQPMPMHEIVIEDGRYVCAPSSHYIYVYDAFEGKGWRMRGPEGIDYSTCAMAYYSGKLYAGIGDKLYVAEGDSLVIRHQFQRGYSISCLLPLSTGKLLVAATDGSVSSFGGGSELEEGPKVDGRIRSMFEDSCGNIWTGLWQGGVVRYSPGQAPMTVRLPMKEIRTFTEDASGNVYAGSVDGIVKFAPDGTYTTEPMDSPGGHAICSLFTDRDGRIWVGTYYDGAYYCGDGNSPLSAPNYHNTQDIRLVNDIVQDKRGDIWVMTDSYGIYRSSDDRWTRVPGTEKSKIKSAYYDPSEDIIWIGRYMEPLLAWHIPSGTMKEYFFLGKDGEKIVTAVNAIVPFDGELLIGTLNSGLWRFDPKTENAVSRTAESDTEVIYCLTTDKDGVLWAGGNGLYKLAGNHLTKYNLGTNLTCVDLCADSFGLWGASVGYGFFHVQGDSISFFNNKNSGIIDNHVSVLADLGGGHLLIGSRSNVYVYDMTEQRCLNWTRSNGLTIGSIRDGCAVKMIDGSYMLGGVNGIERFDPAKLDFTQSHSDIRIDMVSINEGVPVFVKRGDQSLTLKPGWRNLSFNIASFNYGSSLSVRYEYKLEGYDDDWHSFNIDDPVRFNNLRHGRYNLIVRAIAPKIGGEDVMGSCSLGIKLRPEWYESPAVRLLFIAFVLGMAGVILYVAYQKLLLSQRLKMREEENDSRTRFFIKLSHELRTPLALIIGELELFFQKFGHSVPGGGNLQKTYDGAMAMQRIISSFVEIENNEDVKLIEDLPSTEDIQEIKERRTKLPDGTKQLSAANTMLIVDDNFDMLSLLRSVFSSEYKLIEAVNGEDALELARTKQPDIIVSDVMMPKMDGLTLCAKLRANYETCHIPIILLTAHVSEQSNLKGMLSGADDYIAKPFSVEILLARCRNLLETRRMLMEKYALSPSSALSSSSMKQDESIFLNAVIGAIERHLYSDDLNVTTVAKELAMSKVSLNNKLVAASGFSTREFIEDVRLRHSVKLLSEGKRVSEVSDILGFSSPKYFTIRFRKKYGMSPSEYIDQSRRSS